MILNSHLLLPSQLTLCALMVWTYTAGSIVLCYDRFSTDAGYILRSASQIICCGHTGMPGLILVTF